MHDRELFIDGRWRAARRGRRATIPDPATGELVGSTAIADTNDIGHLHIEEPAANESYRDSATLNEFQRPNFYQLATPPERNSTGAHRARALYDTS